MSSVSLFDSADPAKKEVIPTSSDSDFFQFNLSELQANRIALRKGKFRFNNGSVGGFVYVPHNYDFTSDEGFDAILNALGLTAPPGMVFEFGKNFSVVPNTNYGDTELYWNLFPYDDYFRIWHGRDDLIFPNPQRDYIKINTIEHRVKTVLDGISQACAQQSSAIYLLTEPFRGNVIAEFACQSAQREGNGKVASLALFTSTEFTSIDPEKTDARNFPVLPQTDDIMNNNSERLLTEKENVRDEKPEHVIPWDNRYDQRRVKIPQSKFEDDDFVVTQGDLPKYALAIQTDLTPLEKQFRNNYRHFRLDAGLASECTHRLVFESDHGRKRFENYFLSRFQTGMVCTGSTEAEVRKGLEYLVAGRPLFVLEHTGLAADGLAELIRFTRLLQDGCFTDTEEINYYLEYRLPGSVALWNQLCMCDSLWYDVRVVAETLPSKIAYINAESNVIFDVTKNNDVSCMQDTITNAMSTTFEGGVELGGIEKDLDVLQQAVEITRALQYAGRRYRLQSLLFQIFIRLAIFCAVIFTVLQSSSNISDETYEVFKVVNTILPLIGSALIAIEAAFRPSFKYAAILLAEKKVESETFKYRTRTGIYRLRGGNSNKRVRSLFAEKCQEIFHDCMKSDLATGSILSSSSDRYRNEDALWRGRRHDEEETKLTDKLEKLKEKKRKRKQRKEEKRVTKKKDPVEVKSQESQQQLNGFSEAVEIHPDNVVNHFSNWMLGIDSIKKKGHILKQRTGNTIDMFYDASYDYSDIINDTNFQSRWSDRQINNTFYSRSYNFLPNKEFVEEEMEANEIINTWKKREKNIQPVNYSAGKMTSKDYLERRLESKAEEFYCQLPSLTLWHRTLQIMIISLTAASTALVANDLQAWVPVLIAAAATCEFMTTFMFLESRIPAINAAAGELTNVLLWWNGLTLIQSRQPAIKDTLVSWTEESILSQYEQFAGATLLLARKRQNEAKQQRGSCSEQYSNGNRNERFNEIVDEESPLGKSFEQFMRRQSTMGST